MPANQAKKLPLDTQLSVLTLIIDVGVGIGIGVEVGIKSGRHSQVGRCPVFSIPIPIPIPTPTKALA